MAIAGEDGVEHDVPVRDHRASARFISGALPVGIAVDRARTRHRGIMLDGGTIRAGQPLVPDCTDGGRRIVEQQLLRLRCGRRKAVARMGTGTCQPRIQAGHLRYPARGSDMGESLV